MTARVVCVIPCFNSAKFVGSAVQSALDQTYRDCRVVVVDDGSTDGFDRAIAPFEGRIQVIRQPRLGVSAARNAAIAATDSEFLAYLDADDRWMPTKLDTQLQYLTNRKRVGLLHTAVEFIDMDGQGMAISRKEPSADEIVGLVGLIGENKVCVSSALHTREASGQQRFASDLRECEDWDFWLRIAGRGYGIGFIPECLTQYRLHHANTSRRAELMLRGTVSVMDRLLSRERQPRVRHAAAHRRSRAYCDLGDFAYSRRDWKSARELYLRGWRTSTPREFARLMVALLPLVKLGGSSLFAL